MYQVFYTLTIVFLAAWIVFLSLGLIGHWSHAFLGAATLSMGIGLFLRSSKN